MKSSLASLALVALLAGLAPAQDTGVVAICDIIISEIMYNPSNNEGYSEYAEIYNTGSANVDVSGWFLQDEDGMTNGLPAGTVLMPGEALVFIDQDTTVSDFQAAWGSGFQVYSITGMTNAINGLSNGPSATNEILTLRDASGNLMDEVNYDDDGAVWPSETGDSSIFALPQGLTCTDNDDGTNWASSSAGAFAAYASTTTGIYPNVDFGSPGIVDSTSVAFDHDVTCIGAGTIQVTISGGTAGNPYFLAAAFQNTGVAPGGWFYGIDITLAELALEVNDPFVFNGILTPPMTTVTVSGAGTSCPIGWTVDCVAFEIDAATGLPLQTSTAKTISF